MRNSIRRGGIVLGTFLLLVSATVVSAPAAFSAGASIHITNAEPLYITTPGAVTLVLHGSGFRPGLQVATNTSWVDASVASVTPTSATLRVHASTDTSPGYDVMAFTLWNVGGALAGVKVYAAPAAPVVTGYGDLMLPARNEKLRITGYNFALGSITTATPGWKITLVTSRTTYADVLVTASPGVKPSGYANVVLTNTWPNHPSRTGNILQLGFSPSFVTSTSVPGTTPTTTGSLPGVASSYLVGTMYQIGLNTAEVKWYTNILDVTKVSMVAYKNSLCTQSVHSGTGSNGTLSGMGTTYGNLTLTGPGWFSPAGAYYATMAVTNGTQSARAGCFFLGNS
jgi:hypothetical protein